MTETDDELADMEQRIQRAKAAAKRGKKAKPAANGEAPMDEADVDAIVRDLARLGIADYERMRKVTAERLHLRASILDRLVEAGRGKDEGDTKGQGRALDLPPPEPWPEPVEGAALLGDLAAYFGKHLAAPSHAQDALALWTVHCHAFDAFDFTPRLQFKSPTKGAGKSTAMLLLKLVSPKAIEVETVSVAFLFRAIELARPTVLLDEADRYLAEDDELIATINAGVKPGATAGRCVGEDQEPRVFCCHAPVALASIGTLPGTIEDRCIRIMMRRRTRAEAIDPIDEAARKQGEALQRQAARWAVDHAAELRGVRPSMGVLFNRAADRWRALYAVAQVAGGAWIDRARKAMEGIAAEGDDDSDSLGERLLADIRAVLGEIEVEVASADLVERLIGLDGRPWAEMPRTAKPLTQARLAKLLKPFGIWSRDIWIGGKCVRGYPREAFTPAFERYLDA